MKWKMEACWYQIRHALSQSHLTTTSGGPRDYYLLET